MERGGWAVGVEQKIRRQNFDTKSMTTDSHQNKGGDDEEKSELRNIAG